MEQGALKEVGQVAADQEGEVEDEAVFQVNIRGTIFEVYVAPLSRSPNSRLSRLAKISEAGAAVPRFNRNPLVFHSVLDYYVTGELHLPDGVCGQSVRRELEFWELPLHLLAPCCLMRALGADDTQREVKAVGTRQARSNVVGDASWEERRPLTARQRTWAMMEQSLNSVSARIYFTLNLLMILLSLVLLALQTVPAYRRPRSPDVNLTSLAGTSLFTWLKETSPPFWMGAADLGVLGYLTLTVLLRLGVCPDRRAFLSDPLNSLELVGVTLQWIPCALLVFPGDSEPGPALATFVFVLYVFKIMRVFPLLRIVRRYRSIRLMWQALRASRQELLFLVVVLHVAALLFGYLLYLAELWSDTTQVRGIPDALWWGVITMTTVGYGDTVPTTPLGKLVGFACAIGGILLVALPVPIIATNFYVINQYENIADLHGRLQRERGGEGEEGEEGERGKGMRALNEKQSQDTICTELS